MNYSASSHFWRIARWMVGRVAVSLFAFGTASLALAAHVQAADFTWTGAMGNGVFQDANNWSPSGGPPDESMDAAIFDQPGTYLVQLNGSLDNEQLRLPAGNTAITLDLNGSTYSLIRAGQPAILLAPPPEQTNQVTVLDGTVEATGIQVARFANNCE